MKRFFFMIICTLFVFHFTVTALYVLPFNPIKNKINTATYSYMHPFFAQNWQLFAPDPLSRDIYINVQVRDMNKQESNWIDISTPLYEANHKNRFSSVNTLVRIETGAYLQAVNVDELTEKIELKKTMENPDYDNSRENDRKLTDYQKDGIQQLYNFGYYFAKDYFKNEDLEEFRIRVLIEEPIPFSKRNKKDYNREQIYTTYDWESYPK